MKSERSAATKAEAVERRELGYLPQWIVEPDAGLDGTGGQGKWGGRRTINIDEFRRASRIAATKEVLAAYFNVSADLIEKLLKRPKYRAAYEAGRADLKNIIAVKQLEKALSGRGDTVLLIWLGKNVLGQSDTQKMEVKDTTDKDTERQAADSIRAALDHIKTGPKRPELGVVG